MADPQFKIPVIALFYTGLFALLLAVFPLVVVDQFAPGSLAGFSKWPLAAGAMVLWAALLWHVHRRCSGDGFSWWQGLAIIASCMSTGWFPLSLIVVLPALLVAFLCSLLFTLSSDLERAPERAGPRFQSLVARFYRHRLRQ